MAIDLIALGLLYIEEVEAAVIILILLFVGIFELSLGPVLWLYLAETMTEKGMGFAVLLNFIITMVIGAFSSIFLSALGGWSYVFYGGVCVLVSSNAFTLLYSASSSA